MLFLLICFSGGSFMAFSSERTERLKKFPDQINKSPSLENLSGWQWCQLLDTRPQFADRCNWEKLDGFDWGYLLRFHPQFADYCSWEKLDGQSLAWVLEKHPCFASRCNWKKLKGKDWTSLLIVLPEYAEKCYWSRLNGRNWSCLLSYHPQFAERCPWNKLNGIDWRILLLNRPEMAEFCDWEKLDGNDCAELLDSKSPLSPKALKNLQNRWKQLRGLRIGFLDGYWASLEESQCGSCRFLSQFLLLCICCYHPSQLCNCRNPDIEMQIPPDYWENHKQCPHKKTVGLAADFHLYDFALKWLPRLREIFSARYQYEFDLEMLYLGFAQDFFRRYPRNSPEIKELETVHDVKDLTSAIFTYWRSRTANSKENVSWLNTALSRLAFLTAPDVGKKNVVSTRF